MRPETGAAEATVQILHAAADDAEAISTLAGLIWRAHYAEIISPAQIEYMLAQRYDPALIRAQILRGVVWDKVLQDGRIIAYASYCPDPDAAEMKLDKLYVRPGHQRSGHGGLLIARAHAAARRAGCRALVLAVNKANAKALAAYRKYGFRIRESVVQDIGGGFVMDDHILVKDV